MEGVTGDVVLVNGAPWPELEVSATRYRFRILNTSNARRYRLALEPGPREGAAFVQVGSDAGLLDRPVTHDSLPVAPGERFDVVVDFAGYPVGSTVTLVNTLGTGGTRSVMRFRIARRERETSRVPERLAGRGGGPGRTGGGGAAVRLPAHVRERRGAVDDQQ